jgi:thioredoxin 1
MIAFGVFLYIQMRICEREFMKNRVSIIVLVCSLSLLAGCKWFDCNCNCGCCSKTEAKGHASSVMAITSVADFDTKILKATKPVVVDFSAPWCGACQTMAPIFDHVAEELSSSYIFAKVDVDAVGELAQKYGISGIPTIMFFKGGVKVGQVVGALDKEALKKAIETNIKG